MQPGSPIRFVIAITIITVLTAGPARAQLWTPTEITTALWLDAADVSTITQADGLVSAWNDKSGNDRHVTQGSTAKPSFLGNGFNGGTMPSLGFTSPPNTGNSGDSLATTVEDPTAGEWSVFIVLDDQSNDNENWILNVASSTGEQRYNLGLTGPRAGYNNVYGNFAPYVAGEQLLNFELARENKVYRNGNLASSRTIAGWVDQSWNTATRGVRVGARHPGNGHAGMNGKIAELIAVFGIPSESDRQLIEGYLAWKWGLEAELPAAHPYQSAAPVLSEPSTIALSIIRTGTNYEFSWNSEDGKRYDLVSAPDLSAPITSWAVHGDHADIAATPPVNSLTGVTAGGSTRYFAVVEK